MKNKKFFYICLAVFFITASFLFFTFSFQKNNDKQEFNQNPGKVTPSEERTDGQEVSQILGCVTSVKEETVQGSSLTGLIESGEKVTAYFGYYNCHEPERGDIVLIDYAGNKNPIIKIVKGVPGDSFSLKEANGGWNILVNNKVLKNSQEKEYVTDQRGYRMLSLYAKDYNNKIPSSAFLVMGNLVGGSIDSTAFGLIGKNDIIARAYASSTN
jgi:signal peptidase I